MPKKGYKQTIEVIKIRYPHFMEYDGVIPELLVELGSQQAVAKHLGISQMTVCRAAKRVGFKFDGKLVANLRMDKRIKQSLKMKGRPGPWLGKKMSKEMIQKRVEKMKGRPAWNKGIGKVTSVCFICNCQFEHSQTRGRRFCSKRCVGIYCSILYSDGRFKGKNNPLFGRGYKIKEAKARGCYDNVKTPDHTIGKGGYYKGIWMRSSWEIEYANFLDQVGIQWLYEPKRFYFPDRTHYTPDFYIPSVDEYDEVKGHWYPKTIKKFNLMKEFYPDVKIKVVDREIWKNQ